MDKKKIRSLDFSHHRDLKRVRIWTAATFDPSWVCEAISSIPKPRNGAPRDPLLRIELHISFPSWMVYPEHSPQRILAGEVDTLVTSWIAVDAQLSRLIGLDPDAPTTTHIVGGTTAGIALDITVPEVTNGPGEGVAARMFPQLSGIKGFVRLV